MPTQGRSAGQPRGSSIAFLASASIALATAHGQAPPLFAPPVLTAALSLDGTLGVLDATRDGSPDLVLPGLFVGTILASLDERGAALCNNGVGPSLAIPPGAAAWPSAIAMAAGRLDGDERDDLVTVTNLGTVHVHRNLGSTRQDQAAFLPDTIVDSFASAYPANPPFVCYSVPYVEVADVDGDGINDIVVAGGPVDYWTGHTQPGFVTVLRGDGTGSFTVTRTGLPGAVVDGELADLDGDGDRDRLVLLTETGGLGAFTYELVHCSLVTGTPTVLGSLVVGPGRCTALAIADVLGDANVDYVVAQTFVGNGPLYGGVIAFAGDGAGHADLNQWSSPSLPATTGTLPDYIASLQAADFDGDGSADLAILRGRAQTNGQWLGSGASDSEVLLATGPAAASATATSFTLPGFHLYSFTDSTTFALRPLRPQPDLLRRLDLGQDGDADLCTGGLRQLQSNGGAQSGFATVCNLGTPRTGCAGVQALGTPSGGNAAHPARLGFDGAPRLGNPDFACTISNLRAGALVGLMWGVFGYANLTSVHGFQLHLSPSEFGYAAVTTGSGANDGFHAYPLPIPNHPALIGDVGCFQYCYWDPSLGVFGGTQASELWLAQ